MEETMSLNRSLAKPLHVQLEEIIRKQIENKELLPHQAIASENELSKKYNLSRMTVRNVITRLVYEGLLYRVTGKGTYVASPKIATLPISQMGIREQLEALGYKTETKLLSKGVQEAGRLIAENLNIKEGDEVYTLERIRYAEGEPLSLHKTYIPVAAANDFISKDIEKKALCDILGEEYGIYAKRGEETLECVAASEEDADYLKLDIGFPLLYLQYVLYSQNEIPFEFSEVLFRSDRIKLKFGANR
jgi:GntR family transcriptional regulator